MFIDDPGGLRVLELPGERLRRAASHDGVVAAAITILVVLGAPARHDHAPRALALLHAQPNVLGAEQRLEGAGSVSHLGNICRVEVGVGSTRRGEGSVPEDSGPKLTLAQPFAGAVRVHDVLLAHVKGDRRLKAHQQPDAEEHSGQERGGHREATVLDEPRQRAERIAIIGPGELAVRHQNGHAADQGPSEPRAGQEILEGSRSAVGV